MVCFHSGLLLYLAHHVLNVYSFFFVCDYKNNIASGSETLFLAVRTHCEAGVYGVDPSTLELMEDAGNFISS